jgi:hypothetical protein
MRPGANACSRRFGGREIAAHRSDAWRGRPNERPRPKSPGRGVSVRQKEDVIQLACSADGCEKSPVLPNLAQKLHQASLHMPISDCFISDIPLVYGHKFATIFWGANWITPSKAGIHFSTKLYSSSKATTCAFWSCRATAKWTPAFRRGDGLWTILSRARWRGVTVKTLPPRGSPNPTCPFFASQTQGKLARQRGEWSRWGTAGSSSS